ncbi:Translation protein, beta-barrel domain [Propionibacterium ruminifibrarum]|uniref:Large ribosomal subunit assembly factor BipA n=1 Tax=Propionibacterium ruminifibrarum TaxID=1962131 RepID=A0A375HZR2_9ACTN|nr:translational GTPase TypA [Propionibacterium ruminifibrarum]SPF68044.1 Translation protein, beta-barrel domain [Propionibacterium ruminifibrarum]
MPVRQDLRNLAIVAHVDHGKTTLVDAMLWQSGAFREGSDVENRVMDSMDLEREKGITILAKNTAVKHTMTDGRELTLNIIDTPGHADFGGEVERGLEMVDGVILLVDASEGPLPQTRFVLRKALDKKLPIILVVNKVDRPDARIDEVVDETYELFMDLLDDEDAGGLDFPIVYCAAKAGRASLTKPADGELPDSRDLQPLFDLIESSIPAPAHTEGAPLQAHVTNLDSSPYLGRLALCRVVEGTVRRGQNVAWCRRDGSVQTVRLSELLMTEALDRVSVEEAGPGDIIAIAGIPEITIGETICDPADPRPLPLIHVDEPSLSMTIGINTSPLSGRSGTQLTARLVKSRLDAELIGNVSVRVLGTDRPDTWEVQGRGELQLAVLVEMMRREGFELTVGKPEVVTRRDENGTLLEPTDRLTIDVPEEFLGTVTEMMGTRKGTMDQMINHGSGWVRMEYVVPSRGLIGFRTEFLTATRGTGIMNHVSEGFTPWVGEMRNRPTGSLVADRQGTVSSYALFNLQERGELFIAPGDEVYEGMVVGENSRPDEMDVNPTKEKHLTNVRSSTGDELERLIPPRRMSLEQSLEFCAADECLEVTPDAVRVRKVILDARDRAKVRIKNRSQNANA